MRVCRSSAFRSPNDTRFKTEPASSENRRGPATLDDLDVALRDSGAAAPGVAGTERSPRQSEDVALGVAVRVHNTVPTLDRTVAVIVAAWIAAIVGGVLINHGVGVRSWIAANGPKSALTSFVFLPHAQAHEGRSPFVHPIMNGAPFPEPLLPPVRRHAVAATQSSPQASGEATGLQRPSGRH
jgi:hypothetical protein